MIKFNGISSGTLGVYVEKYPARPVPQRKLETFSVPGRSGDIIIVEPAWENVVQEYDIYLSAETAGLPAVAGPVVAWLHGANGYAQLEDDYNPDVFRLACFAGPADLANILNAFGRATISFNCKPQRFLKSGETAVPFAAAGSISNPTAFPAKPLISATLSSGSGTITINGSTLSFSISDSSVFANGLILDCEEHEAYNLNSGAMVNLNTKVSGDWPELGSGANAVSFTGGVTALSIKPRWFEL